MINLLSLNTTLTINQALPVIHHVDFDLEDGSLAWSEYTISEYRDGYYICLVADGTLTIHITDSQIDNPLCGYGRTRDEALRNLLTYVSAEYQAVTEEIAQMLKCSNALAAAQSNLARALLG